MAAPPSPAHRAMQPFTSGFDNDDELPPRKPAMQKQDSKFGRWLSHVHDRLVMRLVCCAPASVVLEVEFEDEDFCRPEDTEIRKIDPHRPSSNKLLKKQKSASVVPVLRGSNRGPSDRDIPTNEELERLPIDLSFVLNDNNDEDSTTPATTRRFVPAPPSTPRHVSLMQRAIQIAAFRQQRSARLIQRRWRQAHARSREAAMTDVEDDGDKTDLETDTEQSNNYADRSTKTRRRRIRKHRGRKKKSNN